MFLDENIKNGSLAGIIYCLEASIIIAEQFDQRPALKFLLQKLCHLDQSSVNMYKTYMACKSLQLKTFTHLTQRDSIADQNQKYFLIINKLLKHILANLNKAEKVATGQKLAAFSREKYSKVIKVLYFITYKICMYTVLKHLINNKQKPWYIIRKYYIRNKKIS